ncbi:hypothetical protein E5676_scaffold19523G00290 [Cucumis melo var. makuwa]|uniref:Uncharacterized protein n=3 Tax=Cucumis melo TaxID=3656 RepID=A0A5D3DFW9_CUCMM|nr:hypothetical protein [Cucumis melo subsp. melo]KAA0063908.1 hypothetical protein E6C27_scaffold616G00340 [Cucumis melo var. makuwa]TYK22492.1 hypothetical protein E5676_scaffold19523G00290 [Cucumis melo var. makuwa]
MVEGENGDDGGRRKRLRSIGWWREKMATMVDGGGRERLRLDGFEWWVADGNDG